MSNKNIEELVNACETLKSNYEHDNFDEYQKEFAVQSDIEHIIEILNNLENQ